MSEFFHEDPALLLTYPRTSSTVMLFAIGSALGGPITGVLAAHTSWRLTFLLPCLPILAISLVSLCLLLPRPAHHTADSHKHSLLGAMDLGGVSLLGLSVGTLLWALSVKAKAPTSATSSTSLVGAMTLGPAPGPNHEVAGWLLVSLAAFVGLIVLERSREKRKLRVLIPTDVVMQRNVFWTSLSAFLMCLANGAVVYNLPLYYTIVRSLTPTSTGLHMLPNSLMLGFGSLLSGQVIRSTGRYRVLGLVSLILPIGSALAMSRWAAGEIGTDTAGRGGWEEWFDAAPAGLGYSSFLVSSLLAILASGNFLFLLSEGRRAWTDADVFSSLQYRASTFPRRPRSRTSSELSARPSVSRSRRRFSSRFLWTSCVGGLRALGRRRYILLPRGVVTFNPSH